MTLQALKLQVCRREPYADAEPLRHPPSHHGAHVRDGRIEVARIRRAVRQTGRRELDAAGTWPDEVAGERRLLAEPDASGASSQSGPRSESVQSHGTWLVRQQGY